jgi:hypothetical protein
VSPSDSCRVASEAHEDVSGVRQEASCARESGSEVHEDATESRTHEFGTHEEAHGAREGYSGTRDSQSGIHEFADPVRDAVPDNTRSSQSVISALTGHESVHTSPALNVAAQR